MSVSSKRLPRLEALAADDDRLHDAFVEQGVVIVGGALAAADVEELAAHVERYRKWLAPAVPDDWLRYEPDGSIHGMYYLDRVDPWFKDFGARDDLRALVARITGWNLKFSSLETFNKPARVGSPSLVHQDGIYFEGTPTRIAHIWIPLDPAREGNGALHYWRGTHRAGLLPHRPVEHDPYLKTIDPIAADGLGAPVVAEVDPGDVVVHSDRVVHASPPNTSPQARRAVGVAYKKVVSPDGAA